jgi:hypothetical protein
VVAKLELNSAIPPPDTIKEELEHWINTLCVSPSHATVNPKREISKDLFGQALQNNGATVQPSTSAYTTTLIARLLRLNLLVNENQMAYHPMDD